jgi:hypothetical protein
MRAVRIGNMLSDEERRSEVTIIVKVIVVHLVELLAH